MNDLPVITLRRFNATVENLAEPVTLILRDRVLGTFYPNGRPLPPPEPDAPLRGPGADAAYRKLAAKK